MELGNAMFGNSRGKYPIKRGGGFEDETSRLFEACASGQDNSRRVYGAEFENDVFSVFPYYWGDCTCGYDQNDDQWRKENDHEQNCPIVRPNFLYKSTGFGPMVQISIA